MVTAREILDRETTEAAWARIVERAMDLGAWHYYHPYDPRHSQTILDYIAWRERVIWVELKTERGRLTRDRWVMDKRGRSYHVRGQLETIGDLRQAGQEVHIWRPHDFEEMCTVLGVDAHALR